MPNLLIAGYAIPLLLLVLETGEVCLDKAKNPLVQLNTLAVEQLHPANQRVLNGEKPMMVEFQASQIQRQLRKPSSEPLASAVGLTRLPPLVPFFRFSVLGDRASTHRRIDDVLFVTTRLEQQMGIRNQRR